MPLDDGRNIPHAAIADFHSLTVENLVQLRPLREVLADELQKPLSNLRFYAPAERRVKPDDAAHPFASSGAAASAGAASVSASVLLLSLFKKRNGFRVAAGLQRSVVQRGGLLEGVSVT